ADDGERRRLLADPAWREGAREGGDTVDTGFFPVRDLNRVRLIEVTGPENEKFLGRSFAELIAARGGHPSDVLADWVLENDLRPGVAVVGIANANVDEVAKLLADPDTVVGSR